MASKFAEFLQSNKIDPRRVLSASAGLEHLRPEDRNLRLLKRKARETGGEKPAQKPRSGRRVTAPLLDKAVEGKPVPGPAKTRILRAINHILTQRKKDPVDLRALF